MSLKISGFHFDHDSWKIKAIRASQAYNNSRKNLTSDMDSQLLDIIPLRYYSDEDIAMQKISNLTAFGNEHDKDIMKLTKLC